MLLKLSKIDITVLVMAGLIMIVVLVGMWKAICPGLGSKKKNKS